MNWLDDAIAQWALGHGGYTMDAALRLVLAATLGGLVGLEREVRGREAGFRTNLLICLGSALVMIVSIRFSQVGWPHEAGINVNIDPARIAYGVMTGIGFLGAGTILKNDASVRGLTTAAGCWCVAAIGLACGFGLFVIASIAAALVLGSLWLLDYAEEGLPRRRYVRLTFRCPWSSTCIHDLRKHLEREGLQVTDHSFRRLLDLDVADVQVTLSFLAKHRHAELEQKLLESTTYKLLASERL